MKKVLKVIVNIFAWLIVILSLLVTILVFSSSTGNGVPNLFGYIPLTVESNSMQPTFNMGDLIICKEIDDANALEVGDVITFWTIIDGKKVKNTHRIAAINDAEGSRSFVTRGDNNPVDDETPAYAGDLIGKWTNVSFAGAGNIMSFLRTKLGFFVCILIPMAIFFLIELYKFIVTLIEVKRPKTPELDEEEIKRRAIEEYLASQKKDGDTEKAEETAKKEDSAKTEEPAKDEASAKAEEPAKTEEPAKAEEPAKSEESAKAEEPAKTEEPAKSEESAKSEEPEKTEEPAQSEGAEK